MFTESEPQPITLQHRSTRREQVRLPKQSILRAVQTAHSSQNLRKFGDLLSKRAEFQNEANPAESVGRTGGWSPARSFLVSALIGVWLGLGPGSGRASAQGSLFDARFEEVRKASVVWDNRPGPPRQVIDLVCLVPDAATFFEAIATWDQGHYFPILIDDVELNFKFLRAFKPARIVRFPSRAGAVAADRVWKKAVDAVGRSWAAEDATPDRITPGDTRAIDLGPLPPGIVLSNPESPALAGAVALAAGRFQPLMKWETARRFNDVLATSEATDLALGLEGEIAGRIPKYGALGDDCDFVTLAGDYPYKYLVNGQPCAFDDLILRSGQTGRRWAFAGRLMGDPVQSVYRAMCALFLHPTAALMYNTYNEKDSPWSDYSMTTAAPRLAKSLPTTHRSGVRAGLAGWHQTFDPVNAFGLIILNTHGGATTFHLENGPGQTADVPETEPVAVLMIHSFSAEAPTDPDTIAGRWLANGAYAYFGSMNEPFLQAFRPPGLVTSFLADNLPIVVAERKTIGESQAEPWRLVYFGDPFCRIKPTSAQSPRAAGWPPTDSWKSYGGFQTPAADAPEDLRLNWAVKMAIHGFQNSSTTRKVDLAGPLLGLARDRLAPALRPLHDDLLVDTLLHSGRNAELIDRLSRIPPSDRSPVVRRHLETAQTAALQRAAAAKDYRQALTLWSDVVRAPGSRDFVHGFTERVGKLADSPTRQADWRTRLRATLKDSADPVNQPAVEAELKRVEALRPTRVGQR